MPPRIRYKTAEIAQLDPRGYRTVAEALRPPPLLTASQFAESGAIVLPEGITSMPGPLSFSRFPYWRPVLDWCSDRETEEVVVCVSSQHGKTNFAMAAALDASKRDPGPVLWLMPTDDMAEEFMRDRFRPMIRASPGLKSEIMRSGSQSADRVDGVQWKSGGYTNISGVAASQKLKGKPVRVLIGDELDEMIRFNPELGDPRERMRTRLRTFAGRSKLILDSTPTSEDQGIWVAWLESQQWTWAARCPHCGELQQMLFPQVRWDRTESGEHPDPEVVARDRLAWYECVH
jgi:phage terminase large subunit GpA-like protein